MRSYTSSAKPARLLYMGAILLIVALCRAAIAQEPAKPAPSLPSYLSNLQPERAKNSFRVDKATMLGDTYKFTVRQDFYTSGEVQYSVPSGYNRFVATVGIDNSAQKPDDEVTFVVIGIDADGHRSILAQDTVKALQKPKQINVSLAGMNTLILQASTPNPYHSLWWGDARFEAGGGTTEVTGTKGTDTQKVLLVFDEENFKAQIQSLAQQLKKGIAKAVDAEKKTGISISQFTLNTLPGQTLDDKIIADIQGGLNDELSKIRALDITPIKESFGDPLKDFVLGDPLTDRTRAAISKSVDDSYVLLGSIADRDSKLVVHAYLYDLHSGKTIADEKVSVPIKGRRTLTPPAPPAAPVKQAISLMFMPDASLRISNYQWFVDGDSKDVTPYSRGISTQRTLLDPGKHKFKLTWNGAGNRAPGSQKDDYQTLVSDEFEIDTSKITSIEFRATIILFPRQLKLSVQAGDQKLSPHWR